MARHLLPAYATYNAYIHNYVGMQSYKVKRVIQGKVIIRQVYIYIRYEGQEGRKKSVSCIGSKGKCSCAGSSR